MMRQQQLYRATTTQQWDMLLQTNTTTSPAETASAPTTVEIYHVPEVTDTENEQEAVERTAAAAHNQMPLLAPLESVSSQILTYHNVPLLNSSTDTDTNELGLWSLAVARGDNGDASLAEMLMKSVVVPNLEENCRGATVAPCFVVNVDLADASRVCATIRSSIDIIVNALSCEGGDEGEDDGKEADNADVDMDMVEMKNRYTSLTALQGNIFGGLSAAAQSKKSVGAVYDKYVSLILAVCLPTKPSSSYQDEQAQALVMYHLYRFALHVNCVVAFVQKKEICADDTTANDDNAEADESEDTIASMDTDSLRDVVLQIASGVSPRDVRANRTSALKEADGDTPFAEDTSPSSLALVTPGSIDSTLVENTMLANANCEGQWDAAVDPLPKALPEQTNGQAFTGHVKATPSESSTKAYSDDEWLSKLASAIKTIEALPSAVAKEEPKSKTNAKKDVAVSSFFENLLKK